jgi:hypothetical protein
VVPVISNPTKKPIHLGFGGDRQVWATKYIKTPQILIISDFKLEAW